MDWGFVRPVLGKPLSLANKDMYGGVTGVAWDMTEIGQLYKENEVSIDHVTVPGGMEYVYRVADAFWIDEDTNIARLRVIGPNGEAAPPPTFICNGKIPIDPQIFVPNGKRTMQAYVASSTYKSELITFGAMTGSPVSPHTTLCVYWQLFPEEQYRQLKMDGVYR